MRHLQGTDEIGDGISMAVVAGGAVIEIGATRAYNPVNPCDIGAVEAIYFDAPVFQATLVSMPMTQQPEQKLTMTMYQRLYQWPNVGPVSQFGGGMDVSFPPVEVPAGQDVWPARPASSVSPVSSEPVRTLNVNTSALDTETIIPQRGNSLREGWTLYKTMPWTPTVFIRNVQLEGDSKQFIVTGTTYERTGVTPIAGCSVVAMGQYGLIVGTTVSNGSGNYSMQVTARPVQIQVYLAGSPDLSGTSRNTIIEGVVNIFMRDPTENDPTLADIATAVWTRAGRTLT